VKPLSSSLSLVVVLAADLGAQNGAWDPAINHVVPTNWQKGQPGWDGEENTHSWSAGHRFMAGHAALIPKGPHQGKILVWNWMRKQTGTNDKQYWSIIDWTTTPWTFHNFELPMPNGQGDLFCAGSAWTKDGHLLVAGGNKVTATSAGANKLCYRFDPLRTLGNQMWVREPDLYYPRWYPTVTAMGTVTASSQPKDFLHVTGGWDALSSVNAQKTYEVFDPTNAPGLGTYQTNPAKNNLPYFDGPNVVCSREFDIYPRDVLLSSGKKFTAGMMDQSYRVLHGDVTVTAPAWELMTNALGFGIGREYGSVVLFPNLGGSSGGYLDLVVRFGGHMRFHDSANCNVYPTGLATNSVRYCWANTATGPNYVWNDGPGMLNPRTNLDATLLPDGTVLITGGRQWESEETKTTFPVNVAESFDGQTWTARPTASVRRGYHSTALLLPDGRVWTGGGEQREKDYEVFRPPYLTVTGLTRPVIVNAPSHPNELLMQYGSTYGLQYQQLPLGVTIEKVVLMAPGAITHHSDMHQRYVELDPDPEVVPPEPPPYIRQFKAPANSNRAPKGYYMLFFVTNPQGPNGIRVPSNAAWVRLQ